MAKVVRPIQFDNPRKYRRNKNAREAKKRREMRECHRPGGKHYYPNFMHRCHQDWLPGQPLWPTPANDDRRK